MKLTKVIVFVLSTSLLCYILAFAGKKVELKDTEEGEIHFRSYYVNVADTFNYTKKIRLFDTAVYYVKGEKIFRTPYLAKPELMYTDTTSGNSTAIYEDLSRPGYLMDFSNRKCYIKESSSSLITKSLDSLASEMLYYGRIKNDPKFLVRSIDTLHPIIVNGKTVFNGVATYLDKPTVFLLRFCKDKQGVSSPLNYNFKGATYPIIAFAQSNKDRVTGKTVSWLVQEITSAESKHIDDKYFSVSE